MKLVVDTNILIDNLRGGTILDNLLDTLKEKEIELLIPTIVVFELYSGKSTKEAKTAEIIEKLLRNFQRIEFTEKIAKRAGELFRDVNKSLGVSDYIIAASALEINATILTLNAKHFEQIPHLPIYPL